MMARWIARTKKHPCRFAVSIDYDLTEGTAPLPHGWSFDYGLSWRGPCPRCGKVVRLIARRVNGTPSDTKCDARCTGARGTDCECSCAGKNHGSAWCGPTVGAVQS